MSRITVPALYQGYVMRPLADGTMDMICPLTGYWSNFKTQRHAKWSASVVVNIHKRMTTHPPLPHSAIPLVPVPTPKD